MLIWNNCREAYAVYSYIITIVFIDHAKIINFLRQQSESVDKFVPFIGIWCSSFLPRGATHLIIFAAMMTLWWCYLFLPFFINLNGVLSSENIYSRTLLYSNIYSVIKHHNVQSCVMHPCIGWYRIIGYNCKNRNSAPNFTGPLSML